MAKVKIILDKRTADKFGRFPVKIRIVAGNTNTSISTGVFAPENCFVGDPEHALSRSFANAKQANADIMEIYYSFVNAIVELDKMGNSRTYTAADIRKYVEQGKEYRSELPFSSAIQEHRESRLNMSQFEKVAFQARKYLRSMKVGEQRTLSQLLCKREDLKNTASQLKKLGEGTWTISKAKNGQTNITRTA